MAMNWLAEALDLPDKFKHSPESTGGGVIYTTCSEATLSAMIAARKQKIYQEKSEKSEEVEECSFLSRLVAYCSDQVSSHLHPPCIKRSIITTIHGSYYLHSRKHNSQCLQPKIAHIGMQNVGIIKT